jgi:CheY-like chemotaxis protein
LIREALREHNIEHELHVLSHGAEALAFIDQLDLNTKTPCPDIVLLDSQLPKHDGPEILKAFRASGRCAETPVVVLASASEYNWSRETVGNNAALHYFRKPILLDQFMQLGGW